MPPDDERYATFFSNTDYLHEHPLLSRAPQLGHEGISHGR